MDSLNQVYYLLKPLMPWAVRMGLRRVRANIKRATHAKVWPIYEKGGTAPPGWPGWPEGKRFAVVLTHDVEGLKGFRRVEQVMNLELQLGFRSSFNFVPEREYSVSEGLRCKIESAGFEIGVHGLKHDGKLYFSREEFSRRAVRIRAYLNEWKAVGFRSPFFHHNLEWLQELGVEYDASTFDTDPFEPQSDGAGTIFPFWVPGPRGSGYVELPYTLVQDFTLFVVLSERTNEIWNRKVDWVAERGGMVLVNTHPDYMWFGDDAPSRGEFPARNYAELITYIRSRYGDTFWHALPREVARFYREKTARGNICPVASERCVDNPQAISAGLE